MGNTLVSAGAIEAELADSLSGSVSVAGGAGLTLPTGNGATGWTGSQIGALLVSASWANNSSLLTIDTTNASVTIANSINQPLSLTKVGPGTLTLAASNTYSGPTTVTGGALNLAHNLAVQNSTVTVSSSGALTFAAGITSPTLGGLAGSASLALATAAAEPVTLNVGQNGQNTTYGGSLSGAGGLNKVGAGTLTLTTSSSYGGATTISNGVLQLRGVVAPGLAHRWGFNNSLTDSVGGVSAILSGNATLGTNQVTITGNGSSHVNYVSLGNGSTNLLPTTNSPYTVELWTTENQPESWSRIFDFGTTAGGPSNLLWSWTQGTNNPSVISPNSQNFNAATFTPGTEYHIALVVTPNGTGSNLSWYQYTDNGTLVASGTDPNNPVAWNISQLTQTNMWLGRSEYGDADANASYNEVRIWNAALTQAQLTQLTVLGPDGNLSGSNLLPIGTPLAIAANGTLDLNGASQQVASLSDGTPGSGGSIINSNTGSVSVLTLSPSGGSTTFSGMIQGGGTLGSIGVVLDGPGTLVLSGTNTYTGGTTVWNGTLQLNNSAALADGSSLSVGSGLAAFGLVEPSAVAAPVAASPAAAVAAVPEPGTLALLGVAGIVAAVAVSRRRRMKS